MDSKLRDAVITNVRGTLELLHILKEATHLESLVLVSTAYSNCCQKIIEEKFYESPIDPDLLVRMAEDLKPEMFNEISLGQVTNSVFRLIAGHLFAN